MIDLDDRAGEEDRRARVQGPLATGQQLDASDRDDAINIANWPVFGMYQPDAIASFQHKGKTYLITANEGDARDYDGFAEEERVEDLTSTRRRSRTRRRCRKTRPRPAHRDHGAR